MTILDAICFLLIVILAGVYFYVGYLLGRRAEQKKWLKDIRAIKSKLGNDLKMPPELTQSPKDEPNWYKE